ncbi:MAG: ribonuclease III domain-containing protein [Cyanobacteria bacterium J06628_4]
MVISQKALDNGPGTDDPRRQQELRQFVAKLGLAEGAPVRFELLHQALVDISKSADYNNEVLEFLGDAALRLAAAEFLQETCPQMSVGEMAAVRSQLVSDRTLAMLAQDYNFGRYLQISTSAATRAFAPSITRGTGGYL